MSSSFSFHCTICYNELDRAEYAPVILPCGHTFICQQCATKLDKCMECRYPLFQQVKSSASRPPYEIDVSPLPEEDDFSLPGENLQRKPLPMPKNFVLMSLIESSSCIRKLQENGNTESNQESEWFKKGMQQMMSTSGTFVVRDPRGLSINESKEDALEEKAKIEKNLEIPDFEFETPLNSGLNSGESCYGDCASVAESIEVRFNDLTSEMDVLDMSSPDFGQEKQVCFAQEKQVHVISDSDEDSLDLDSMLKGDEKEDEKLEYGKTVQVVEYKDGIAKIARGLGYLNVNSRQLVKVGEAHDKACEIEGKLAWLKKLREDLSDQMKAIDNRVESLNSELSDALLIPFTNKVIEQPKPDLHKSCPEIKFNHNLQMNASCPEFEFNVNIQDTMSFSSANDDISVLSSVSELHASPSVQRSRQPPPSPVRRSSISSISSMRTGRSGHGGAFTRRGSTGMSSGYSSYSRRSHVRTRRYSCY